MNKRVLFLIAITASMIVALPFPIAAQDNAARHGVEVLVTGPDPLRAALRDLTGSIAREWQAPEGTPARYRITLTTTERTLDACEYTDGSTISRTAVDVDAIITDLDTGELLATTNFVAVEASCPAFVMTQGDKEQHHRYNVPDPVVFDAWVRETLADRPGMDPLRGTLVLLADPPSPMFSANYSPDGRRIVTGSKDMIVRVWDATTGEELQRYEGHTDILSSAVFSPDSQQILTSSYDNTARVWDVASGAEVLRLEGHENWLAIADYSPDGSLIVTGSADETARVWDATSGKELLRLAGYNWTVNAVAFTPDGQRIVTGSLGSKEVTRVWDVETGQELLTIPIDSESLSVSPDGSRVATVNRFSGQVWDLASGEMLVEFTECSGLTSVAYSPDGRLIAGGSGLNAVCVWDAETGELLLKLSGHSDRVGSVAFSPDGRALVSAGWDNTVRVWVLP